MRVNLNTLIYHVVYFVSTQLMAQNRKVYLRCEH